MKDYNAFFVAAAAAIVAYFDTTYTFLFALFLGFALNIIAGLRADEVKITTMYRFPHIRLLNYDGHKLKDSLMELFLIISITYIIKQFIDWFKYNDKSTYAVQILLAVAVYYYLVNSLRNLKKVRPKSKFIAFVYYVCTFQFKEMLPGIISKAMNKVEEEEKEGEKKNG
ncbi:MAG TPA: hypothetical protein DDW85_01630 [Porphyromonadaceae bacterium]|nr:hypothetical protein [Porphyromonadaceae bacterium]